MDSNNAVAIKIQPLSQANEVHYFGFTNGTSTDPNSIEINEELARLLGLEDGDLVQASIEYSFEKLKAIELEPLTPEDFEIIEKNSEFIEEHLLNQVGVFYDKQKFVIYLHQNTSARLISKVRSGKDMPASKCFFLTVSSELHIAPK